MSEFKDKPTPNPPSLSQDRTQNQEATHSRPVFGLFQRLAERAKGEVPMLAPVLPSRFETSSLSAASPLPSQTAGEMGKEKGKASALRDDRTFPGSNPSPASRSEAPFFGRQAAISRPNRESLADEENPNPVSGLASHANPSEAESRTQIHGHRQTESPPFERPPQAREGESAIFSTHLTRQTQRTPIEAGMPIQVPSHRDAIEPSQPARSSLPGESMLEVLQRANGDMGATGLPRRPQPILSNPEKPPVHRARPSASHASTADIHGKIATDREPFVHGRGVPSPHLHLLGAESGSNPTQAGLTTVAQSGHSSLSINLATPDAAPSLAPEVHIRIGRIDIRGAAPTPAPVTRPVPPKPPAPSMNLDAYLRGLDRRPR
jgi:hypothetical protein